MALKERGGGLSYQFQSALIIKGNLEAILQAGFTTIRSMGGDHWYLKKAIEDGLIKGLRLLRARA